MRSKNVRIIKIRCARSITVWFWKNFSDHVSLSWLACYLKTSELLPNVQPVLEVWESERRFSRLNTVLMKIWKFGRGTSKKPWKCLRTLFANVFYICDFHQVCDIIMKKLQSSWVSFSWSESGSVWGLRYKQNFFKVSAETKTLSVEVMVTAFEKKVQRIQIWCRAVL